VLSLENWPTGEGSRYLKIGCEQLRATFLLLIQILLIIEMVRRNVLNVVSGVSGMPGTNYRRVVHWGILHRMKSVARNAERTMCLRIISANCTCREEAGNCRSAWEERDEQVSWSK
jgi:hypothetical protein